MKRVTPILFIVSLFIILLFGCRSSNKVVSESKKHEQTNLSYDIEKTQTASLNQQIQTAINKAILEQLNLKQTITEYDTERPKDSITGQHPIIKKTETNLTKLTEDKSIEKETNQSNEVITETKKDKSNVLTEIKSESTSQTEQNTQKESTIFLKWVGMISLVLLSVALGVAAYMIYRRIRKKLPLL